MPRHCAAVVRGIDYQEDSVTEAAVSSQQSAVSQTVKVFEMADGCTWMAGESLPECIAVWLDSYSGEPDEDCEAHEISEETLRRVNSFDENTGETKTAWEWLQQAIRIGSKFPLFLCSTEY
jgi:hypothetical protein